MNELSLNNMKIRTNLLDAALNIGCTKAIKIENLSIRFLSAIHLSGSWSLWFRPSSKSMRIEACCDKLRSEGMCENLIQMRLGKTG